MGSKAIQSHLWGQRAQDWAAIQEPTGQAGYDYVLNLPEITPGKTLLDVGCGTGYFCKLAGDAGLKITGADATPQFIAEAQQRLPSATFLEAEMEDLPFGDGAFDIICGFNSFQYAADVKNAFGEARRVLKPGGTLTAMIWGNKEDCEAAAYLKAVGSLMPPPPPGAPGPFALSEGNALKDVLLAVGFKDIQIVDIPGVWNYPDAATAMKGLMSAGPVARAVENSGYQVVFNAIAAVVKLFTRADGHVVFKNKYRIATAKK